MNGTKLYCICISLSLNPLSANPIKWSNTLKQFVVKLPKNCLSVFDHFVRLVLKGLTELVRFHASRKIISHNLIILPNAMIVTTEAVICPPLK